MDISKDLRPSNLRRYESVYDVIHMDEPFSIQLKDSGGWTPISYTYPGWDAGIYVMYPIDKSIDPFLMTAKEFRGKYRLAK